MNLCVAGVGKESAFLVGFPVGCNRASHGVGGEVENIDVAAGCKTDSIGSIAFHRTGYQVTHRDAAGNTVNNNEVKHFATIVHLDRTKLDLTRKSRVGTQQKLLPGLSTSEEGTGNLCTTEGAVIKITGIVPTKRNTLRHALVDDVVGHLGQTPDVCLTGAEVATLDGIVEQTVDRIAVIRIVLGSIDAALRCDGVGATRAVLIAERLHVVAKFAKGSSSGATGQAGADNNHVVLTFICGIDQLQVEAVLVPGLFNRSGWTFSIKYHNNPLNLSECRQILSAGW